MVKLDDLFCRVTLGAKGRYGLAGSDIFGNWDGVADFEAEGFGAPELSSQDVEGV